MLGFIDGISMRNFHKFCVREPRGFFEALTAVIFQVEVSGLCRRVTLW
jgi:hypothetical protein